MNVSLTPKLEEFVRRKVASGLYNNASEVIREALRHDFQRDLAANETLPKKKELHDRLAALEKPLRKRGVVSLALFGSFVHGEAHPDSDIDVLVDIDPKIHFSLTDLASLKHFLEKQLEREVDVITKQGIEPTIRDKILQEAESIF